MKRNLSVAGMIKPNGIKTLWRKYLFPIVKNKGN